MITFPEADVIPFGEHGDKLGMTRYEILQMVETYNAYFTSAAEIHLTLLFGYIVAMYLAGPKLSRVQYVIANTMFLLVMAFYALTMYWTQAVSAQWNALDGYYGDEWATVYYGLMPHWLSLVQFSLQWALIIGTPILAVWFGWRIRKNPPQDSLNLPEAIE